MAKSRVTMQPTRAKEVSTQQVPMLNPDAWREGKTTAERGYGGRWQRYRLAFLERNALCVMCQKLGKVTAATVVDHIEDHRGDQGKFWDKANHQALCKPCHSAKTAADGGVGAARRG